MKENVVNNPVFTRMWVALLGLVANMLAIVVPFNVVVKLILTSCGTLLLAIVLGSLIVTVGELLRRVNKLEERPDNTDK